MHRHKGSHRPAHWRLVVAATTSLLLPAPAVAGDGGRLEARGCTEPAAIVSVKPARARAELPAGYRPQSILGATGDATLLMGITRCQAGVLNGTALEGGFVLGERVLQVAPRSRAAGFHFYAIEQVTDRPEIAAWLRAAGYPIQLDPSVIAYGGAASARASGDGVDLRIGWPANVISPLSTVSIWRDGPAGRALFTITVRSARAQAGLAQVRVDPRIPSGATIGRLIGGTSTWGIGAVNRFDYTATLTLPTPAAAPTPTPAPAGANS